MEKNIEQEYVNYGTIANILKITQLLSMLHHFSMSWYFVIPGRDNL